MGRRSKLLTLQFVAKAFVTFGATSLSGALSKTWLTLTLSRQRSWCEFRETGRVQVSAATLLLSRFVVATVSTRWALVRRAVDEDAVISLERRGFEELKVEVAAWASSDFTQALVLVAWWTFSLSYFLAQLVSATSVFALGFVLFYFVKRGTDTERTEARVAILGVVAGYCLKEVFETLFATGGVVWSAVVTCVLMWLATRFMDVVDVLSRLASSLVPAPDAAKLRIHRFTSALWSIVVAWGIANSVSAILRPLRVGEVDRQLIEVPVDVVASALIIRVKLHRASNICDSDPVRFRRLAHRANQHIVLLTNGLALVVGWSFENCATAFVCEPNERGRYARLAITWAYATLAVIATPHTYAILFRWHDALAAAGSEDSSSGPPPLSSESGEIEIQKSPLPPAAREEGDLGAEEKEEVPPPEI